MKAALERHKSEPVAPLKWPGPYVLEKRFFHSASADAEAAAPGVERVDSLTVRLRSDSILDIIWA